MRMFRVWFQYSKWRPCLRSVIPKSSALLCVFVGKRDVQIHVFLSSALVGDKWSASNPGRFTSGETAPGTHWRRGLVGPRAGLDDVKKRKFLTLIGFKLRPLGRPARSPSLYRLRYPGFLSSWIKVKISILVTCRHTQWLYHSEFVEA
jgi:hypothetical protein